MPKTIFYNIDLDILNCAETLLICNQFINTASNHLLFFINAHCFNIAQKNFEYKDALNKADLLLNDGIGIKLGAKLAGIRLKENMNGTDFVPKIFEFAKDHGINIYLLGGMEGIAETAKQKTEIKVPGISIVGVRNGFFDFTQDQEIIDDIVKRKTDILIVGMGVPRQELWLTKNKDKLTGVKISIAAGAILDFISGKVSRAPKWMRHSGIEWIFRFLQEPGRLFKRYAFGIPLFYYNIIKLK